MLKLIQKNKRLEIVFDINTMERFCHFKDGKTYCKFEVQDGQPSYDKCSTCDWFRTIIMTGGLDLEDVQKDLFKNFESSVNLDYKCIKLHFKSD